MTQSSQVAKAKAGLQLQGQGTETQGNEWVPSQVTAAWGSPPPSGSEQPGISPALASILPPEGKLCTLP